MPTYFFSYDEDGMTFFDNPHDCLDNTPRSIDCYVYIGPETKEWCKENPSDCRELHVTDYLKKENEKLKLQIKQHHNIISKIGPQRTHWNNLIVKRNKEIKKLKEEIEKLKKENELVECKVCHLNFEPCMGSSSDICMNCDDEDEDDE